jgi:2-polyprenyl-6-methoxyphenol hydroxylase-like FAD-dependent oxidoreductase
MHYTDVAIVGGGLAGSTAAAMLGRAGIAAILIDPHTTYPPELRCEKLAGEQLDLLRKTGLADATLRATTFDGEVWEARFGYVVARKPSDQHGCTIRWSTPCVRRFHRMFRCSMPRRPASQTARNGRKSYCRPAKKFQRGLL